MSVFVQVLSPGAGVGGLRPPGVPYLLRLRTVGVDDVEEAPAVRSMHHAKSAVFCGGVSPPIGHLFLSVWLENAVAFCQLPGLSSLEGRQAFSHTLFSIAPELAEAA